MELKKSLASGLAFLTVAMMTACSNSYPTNGVSPDDYKNVKVGSVDPSTNNIYLGDAGNGKKGADLNFTINFPDEGFKTKAATNGVTQGLASQITDLRVIVTSNNGSTSSPLTGPFLFNNKTSIGSAFSSGTSKTFTISNLSTAGTYFVGVQFFNGSDNITKELGYGTGGSTLVGLAMSSSFTVSINPADGVISVTPTGGVSIAAALRDGVGAKVTADVTPTNGTAIGSVSVDNP